MTTSPDTAPVEVLRGAVATEVPVARLDGELRSRRFTGGTPRDGRLADPTLDGAFDELAEEVRAAARAEGYAVGWAAGHEEATRQVRNAAAEAAREQRAEAERTRAALMSALQALAAGAEALERRAVTPAEQMRDAVLVAAVELTETLLGRELAVAREPGIDALRRALELAPAARPVTARLNPVDAAAVTTALNSSTRESLGRDVTVVPDASVETAGCIVECDATRIDAQLSTALARVRELLS